MIPIAYEVYGLMKRCSKLCDGIKDLACECAVHDLQADKVYDALAQLTRLFAEGEMMFKLMHYKLKLQEVQAMKSTLIHCKGDLKNVQQYMGLLVQHLCKLTDSYRQGDKWPLRSYQLSKLFWSVAPCCRPAHLPETLWQQAWRCQAWAKRVNSVALEPMRKHTHNVSVPLGKGKGHPKVQRLLGNRERGKPVEGTGGGAGQVVRNPAFQC